jgi:hypothetical protein
MGHCDVPGIFEHLPNPVFGVGARRPPAAPRARQRAASSPRGAYKERFLKIG